MIPTTSVTYIEVVMRGIAGAEGSNPINVINVYHFYRGTYSLPIVKAHIESAFQSYVVSNVLATLNSSYTQSWNSVRYIQDPTDAAVEFAESGTGVITGDRFPTYCSAYLLLRTTLRGRSFRGSKHYGPMSESDSTSGAGDVWNAAALARLNTLAAAVAANVSDADGNVWQPVVVSKTLSNFSVVPAIIAAQPIVSALVNKRIGSMRRRKVKSVY